MNYCFVNYMNNIRDDFIIVDVDLKEFLSILEPDKPIDVYTDGSCSGNPGPGGWGAILTFKNKRTILSGYEQNTTNNRMELMAALNALRSVPANIKIFIYTDSSYVKNGMTEWLSNWKVNNWKTTDNKPVKNVDLWIQLDEVSANRSISWNWVKGHSDCVNNNNADFVAKSAMDKGIMHSNSNASGVVYRNF